MVVENFKVGGLEKFGLDAKSLRAANPRLIYASITGFGQDGPYADRAGYDYIIQGMGGLMSITGLPDGEPGGGPMRVGVAVVDLFTGLYTCVAILSALYAREKTGEGAHIDMALFDTQLAMLANQASNCSDLAARTRRGRATPIPTSCRISRSRRPISRSSSRSATTASSRDWRRFAAIPNGRSTSASLTTASRVANRAEIVRLVGDAIRTKARRRMAGAVRSRRHSRGPDQ